MDSPSAIKGIAQLHETFRSVFSRPDVLRYDPTADLTWILGDEFADLVEYLTGRRPYDRVSGRNVARLAHERQHFVDLSLTAFGLRSLETFLMVFREHSAVLHKFATTGEYPGMTQLGLMGSLLESHLQRSGLKVNGPIPSPMMFVGLRGEVDATWKMTPKPQLEAIGVTLHDPLGDGFEAEIRIGENSILELSALCAEFSWRRSTSGAQSEADQNAVHDALEKELFHLVHDLHRPDYCGAFFVAHFALQHAATDWNGNWPLSKSLALGGVAARLALHIVGTNSARRMAWASKLTSLLDPDQSAAELFADRLTAVFYNLVELAVEHRIDSQAEPHDWLLALLRHARLGGLEDVFASSLGEIRSISNPHAGLVNHRVSRALQTLERVRLPGQHLGTQAWMFLEEVHPIDWSCAIVHLDQPVMVANDGIDAVERQVRVDAGLTQWRFRLYLQALRNQVEAEESGS